MCSLLLCLALVATSAFSKSVTLDELKRSISDYKEKRQDDLNLGGLFGPKGRQSDDLNLGGLFGPQGRQVGNIDLGNMFGPQGGYGEEKRDSMEQMERLMVSVKEAQAAIDAGTMELRMPSRAQKRSGHTYTMCVFCDDMCLAQIAGAGLTTDGYFDTITADMNSMLSGVDEGSAFALSYKLIPGAPVYLSWFGAEGLTGEALLTAINAGFWDATGLYGMANDYGCDVDFMVSSSADPSWGVIGTVAGIANMMQLCQMSFSTVKMSDDPHSTATLMTHEFGHMVGMYHDGPLASQYTDLAGYFEPGAALGGCNAHYVALTEQCVAGVTGIMSPAIDGTEFSACSAAYFDMFLCMAEVMPAWYQTACVDH